MSVELITDERIAEEALKILQQPMRLVELREKLRENGIMVSYSRLRKVMDRLVKDHKVVCFKLGKAVLYAKLY